MALERKWQAVPAVNFTADGTALGVVTVTDTAGFRVKGYAGLSANTKPTILVQIQRVLSPTQMIVGPPNTTPSPSNFQDVSAYTVALNATIAFPEQDKNKIKADDIDQAVYEADPVVAKRVFAVDQYGQPFSAENPLPTTTEGLAPPVFGDVKIAYDLNSNPTDYTFYSKTVLQGSVAVTYDSNGNAVDYQGFDENGNPK